MTQHPTEPAKVAQGGSEAAGTDILARVDEVTEGVTEGPWEQNGNSGVHTLAGRCIALTYASDWNGQGANKRDARFIAAARTLVPELRDEIARLQGEKQLVEVELAMTQDGFARWKSRADSSEAEERRLRGLYHEYFYLHADAVTERDKALAEVERLRGALNRLPEILVAHRPYGLDCACGEPINSNRQWAAHVEAVLRGHQ